MSEFNTAFVKFIEYIYSYKHKYKDFGGHALGGFKKGVHLKHYQVLSSELTSDIMIESLLSDLVSLYSVYNMNVNPLAISSVAVQFLDDCLTPEFTINGDKIFQAKDLVVLKKIRDKMNSAFNPNVTQSTTPSATSSTSTGSQSNSNDLSFENKLNSLFNLINNLSAKVDSLELNKDSKKTNLNVRPPTFKDIGVDQEAGVQLERLINSKLRYSNHLNVFSTHLNREPFTCPPAYYSCYFPKPFLWDNEKYVEMHNERIKKTQLEWMQQDIKFINNVIDEAETSILNLKDVIELPSGIEFNKVVGQIETQVSRHLEPFVSASSEKLNREIKMLYYNVRNNKQFVNNNDDTNSTNHNTSNISRNSGKHPSKKRRYRSRSQSKSVHNNLQQNNKQNNYNQNKPQPNSYKATDSAFSLVKKVSIASSQNSYDD